MKTAASCLSRRFSHVASPTQMSARNTRAPQTPITNTHGGARSGAGRPSLQTKFAEPIRDTREYCAARLPETLATLEALSSGTVEHVQERWVAAGTIMTGRGAQARPAFPDLPPDQLVLVSRTVTRPKPDVRANIYLADRVLGRPHAGDEEQIGEQVSAELAQFIHNVQERFSHQAALAIFHRLTDPNYSPPAHPDDDPDEQQIIAESNYNPKTAPTPVSAPSSTTPPPAPQPVPTPQAQRPVASIPQPQPANEETDIQEPDQEPAWRCAHPYSKEHSLQQKHPLESKPHSPALSSLPLLCSPSSSLEHETSLKCKARSAPPAPPRGCGSFLIPPVEQDEPYFYEKRD